MNILLSRILKYLNGTLFLDDAYRFCVFFIENYIDFYKTYSKSDDTYFHISFLEDRPLSDKEITIRNEYRKMRDENCKKAKEEFIANNELDVEHLPTHHD